MNTIPCVIPLNSVAYPNIFDKGTSEVIMKVPFNLNLIMLFCLKKIQLFKGLIEFLNLSIIKFNLILLLFLVTVSVTSPFLLTMEFIIADWNSAGPVTSTHITGSKITASAVLNAYIIIINII